jgi:hypothetical protein
MGKARIVSGGEDGLYQIEVLHARERIDAEIARLTSILDELDEQITALESEREQARLAQQQARLDLDDAVREYGEARDAAIAAGDPLPPPPDFSPLIVAVQQAAAEVSKIDAQIAVLKARRLETLKRRQALQAIPADQVQQAWCADLTESLSGEVGTVELPGEGTVGQFLTWRRMLVRPGYEGAATYSAARDGQLFHRAGMSPEQAFYNAAILPGWQRWMPLHRIGTITAIDFNANTCTLNLQSEDSSAQSLIIDPPIINTLTFSSVPIEYMDCDSTAFEEGDRVLVEFTGQKWDAPKVIGFESNPKPCSLFAAFPITYRVGANSAASSAAPCYPPKPADQYHDGWLSTFAVRFGHAPLVFQDKTGIDSLIAAAHWDEVDASKAKQVNVGSGYQIASSSDISSAIPVIQTTRFSYNEVTKVCSDMLLPLNTNQIKRMYQLVGGVIAVESYPTWPIALVADVTDSAVDLIYEYRTSADAGYYVEDGSAVFMCSEEMNDPVGIDLGEAASLAGGSFPDISGFEAVRVVKAIPGTARVVPDREVIVDPETGEMTFFYSGFATIQEPLRIVVEYAPKSD